MNTVLLVLLIVLLFGAFVYSPTIGSWPAGVVGTVLLTVIVLVLFGRI